MNAPGKGLLKTVSILFIVFGAIALVVSLFAVFVSAAATVYTGGFAAILLIATILMLIVSVLEFVIGIMGVKKSADPTKAGFFIVTGIVLCALALVSTIMSIAGESFSVTGLIGFVLPILYIVGGNMNKKAVAAPMAPPAAPVQ